MCYKQTFISQQYGRRLQHIQRTLECGPRLKTEQYGWSVRITTAHKDMKTKHSKVKKGSPYSNTEHRVPQLIPVLGSQAAGDVSHKPGGRLPSLSARPAVTLQPLRGMLPILLLGEQGHNGCEQFA